MYPPSYIRECEAALKLYLAPWQQVEHGDKGLQTRNNELPVRDIDTPETPE
jgi:hypothetical protein